MNIWDFQEQLTRRLLVWAGFSVGVGLLMNRQRNSLLCGMGEQFIGWGAVDGLIAWFVRRGAQHRQAQPDAAEPAVQAKATASLRRLLWINTGLDVFYVLGGWRLLQTHGRNDAHWRGRGWGIVIQGGFLLLFDLFHAQASGEW